MTVTQHSNDDFQVTRPSIKWKMRGFGRMDKYIHPELRVLPRGEMPVNMVQAC